MRIILSAQTDSEWDNCNFCVATVNFPLFLKRVEQFKKLRAEDETLKSMLYSASEVDFYNNSEEDIEEGNIKEFSGDTANFEAPQQKLNLYTISVTDMGVQFMAYGKNSFEEFYSETLTVDEMQNLSNTNQLH